MRQASYALLAAICIASWTGTAGAWTAPRGEGRGPEQIVLQTAIDKDKVARPAYFPHRAHQESLECVTCHHGKDAAGQRIAYEYGQKIGKCESCHNSKEAMPERVATMKRASHALCLVCHIDQDAELAKCGVCHTKK